ncbi:MAG: 5-formyltetrahydrofolate cyclo-ligase [Acidimicrobiia bacterium]|nr:5-formyltetrahydrofolate cyclo-ligase [Acidimicrobiia bacterium]
MSWSTPEMKARLRAEARRMPPPTAAESDRVCRQVLGWLAPRRPGPTLVWMAIPGELDLEPVVARLSDIEWLTTRTPAVGPLTVHSYHSPLELHRFGFTQPVASAPEVSPNRIDVALAPGLAFDTRGGRLGRGKSYYDRLLAGLSANALRVGVTLERLMTETVPTESHDVSMTHLITENGVREMA